MYCTSTVWVWNHLRPFKINLLFIQLFWDYASTAENGQKSQENLCFFFRSYGYVNLNLNEVWIEMCFKNCYFSRSLNITQNIDVLKICIWIILLRGIYLLKYNNKEVIVFCCVCRLFNLKKTSVKNINASEVPYLGTPMYDVGLFILYLEYEGQVTVL
jgi:hypothetical protein